MSAERNWSQDKKNACGYTLPDLCSALKEVAQYYGLVCYDLNAFSGVTQADFADGIQPNERGAAKIADSLGGFLLQNVYYEFKKKRSVKLCRIMNCESTRRRIWSNG